MPTALVAHAQTSFGTITGNVMDPSSALISDAQVTIAMPAPASPAP